MRFSSTIFLQCLAVKALANYVFTGSNSSFVLAPLANGSRVTSDLYSHCKYEYEGVAKEGKDCIGEAVKIMIAFLKEAGSTHQDEGEAVALLNDIGVGDEVLQHATRSVSAIEATASSGSKPKRAAAKSDELLENFNDRLLRRSGSVVDIRALGVDHSTVEPHGGLTIRTNVRSDDATLFVHANSSHAAAAFKKDPPLSIGKRTIKYDQGIQFQGMQGFKIMVRWLDKGSGLDGLEAALLPFVTGSTDASP